MPPFNLDLSDPRPEAVEKAMCDAAKTANGKARIGLMTEDWADYRRFLTAEFTSPEGVALWLAEKGRVQEFPDATTEQRPAVAANRSGARPARAQPK